MKPLSAKPARAGGSRRPRLTPEAEEHRSAMYAAVDMDEFIDATFRFLQAVVPGEFVSVNLTGRHQKISHYRSSDGFRLEAGDLLELFKNHPGYSYVEAHPGIKFLAARTVLAPEPELFETDFYKNGMEPLGWRYAIALLFYTKPTIEGFVCIYSIHRTREQGDFTPEEDERLRSVHSIVDRGLRRLRRLNRERAAASTLSHFFRKLPLAALVLDWNLCLELENPAAREACVQWHALAASSPPMKSGRITVVPEEILNSCRKLQAEWETTRTDSNGGSPGAKVDHPTQEGFHAEISLPGADPDKFTHPTFLVEFHLPADSAEGEARIGLLSKLTSAERAVAGLVCRGLSNKEVAERLGRSVSTVKKQLHSACAKLGVESRAKLTALLG